MIVEYDIHEGNYMFIIMLGRVFFVRFLSGTI